MKKKILSILKYSIFLSIGVGLVWWQVSRMSPGEKEQFLLSLQNAHWIYALPIVIIGILSHYFRALRWKLLIDPIGNVSKMNAFYATLTGYFGNTFVPRAGEILRCTMLSRYEKIPFSKLIGTVIVERVFDLVSFAFFIFLTVIVQIDVVRDFVSDKIHLIFSPGSGFPVWAKLLIFLAVLAMLYIFTNWFLKRFSNHKFVAKLKDLWNELKEGLATILHLKKKGSFLVYTFLIWGMYLLQIYLGFQTIDVTAHLGIGAAMSVLTLSTLAMIIAPGGLGAFPVAVQQVLLVYHVDNISFGWLVWGANTAIIIIAGGISFLLLMHQNKKVHEKSGPDSGKNLHPAGT